MARKSGSSNGSIKRPKAMEIDYWREEMQRTLKGLMAPAAIFAVQLFMPQRIHVFVPNLVSLLMVTGAQSFTAWALKWTKGKAYGQSKKAYTLNSIVHHMVRTFAHMVYIAVDHEDMFGRLFFVFVTPCSAARISSYSSFVGFLVVHLALLIYRFGSNLIEDAPFMITALACVHILYETSLLKKRAEENALEKSSAMVTMTEDIAENVLNFFCDATARISLDLRFVQESASLSSLLSRSVRAGRYFTDFIHIGDRDYYRDFMEENIASAEREEEMNEANPSEEIDHVERLRLRSIDLHLEDAMSIPFEAHVFQARLNNLDEAPVYLIGISERESYKYTRKKSSKPGAQRMNRTDRTRLDFESGKLTPSRPAFDKKDMAVLNRLRDDGHQAARLEQKEIQRSFVEGRHQRLLADAAAEECHSQRLLKDADISKVLQKTSTTHFHGRRPFSPRPKLQYSSDFGVVQRDKYTFDLGSTDVVEVALQDGGRPRVPSPGLFLPESYRSHARVHGSMMQHD